MKSLTTFIKESTSMSEAINQHTYPALTIMQKAYDYAKSKPAVYGKTISKLDAVSSDTIGFTIKKGKHEYFITADAGDKDIRTVNSDGDESSPYTDPIKAMTDLAKYM
jgi:hypothetical protein